MSQIQYYIIDTESTGLKAGWHELIQISVIRCEDKFQKTVNIRAEHPRRASPEALQITGKTIFDLSKGIDKKDAVEQIHSFLEEDNKSTEHRCLIAHNYSFDQRFCHTLWGDVSRRFPAELWMCTKAFTKKFAEKQGLEKIASIQGTQKAKFDLHNCLVACGLIIKDGAHNAVIDSQNTLSLWNFLMQENLGHVSLIKRVPHKFGDLVC